VGTTAGRSISVSRQLLTSGAMNAEITPQHPRHSRRIHATEPFLGGVRCISS
jgi:hypothetical protein